MTVAVSLFVKETRKNLQIEGRQKSIAYVLSVQRKLLNVGHKEQKQHFRLLLLNTFFRGMSFIVKCILHRDEISESVATEFRPEAELYIIFCIHLIN
jgi:hypothetical protein